MQTPQHGAAVGPGSRVLVCGLQSQPQLNGQSGTVVDWDEAEGRWRVRLDSGAGKLLKPANVQLVALPQGGPPSPPPREPEPPEPVHAGWGEPAELAPGMHVEVCNLLGRAELNGQTGQIVDWDPSEGRWRVRMADGTGKIFRPTNLRLCRKPTTEAWRRSADLSPATVEQPVKPASVAEPAAPPASGKLADAAAAVAPGDRVQIFGLQAQPHLNGQHGTVVDWDETERRWKVRLDDGSGKLLRESNVEVISQRGRAVLGAAAESRSGPPTGGAAKADSFASPAAASEAGKLVMETPAAAASSSRPPPVALAPGDRVRVSGLAAQPQLNGQCGTLVGFDVAEGRWKVRMDDGAGKAVKEANLQAIGATAPDAAGAAVAQRAPAAADHEAAFAPGMHVEVHSLQSRADLNGQRGYIVAWEESEGRWKVHMEDGTGKLLRPANLRRTDARDEVRQDVRTPRSAGSNVAEKAAAPETSRPPSPPRPTAAAVDFAPPSRAGALDLKAQPVLGAEPGAAAVLEEKEGRRGGAHVPKEPLPTAASWAPSGLLAPGDAVRIVGLSTQPQLNGQRGTLVAFDLAEGRWKVRLDDGSGKLVREANLEPAARAAASPPPAEQRAAPVAAGGAADLGPGVHVEVHGLQARPDLNGQRGRIVEWEESEGRWKVHMDDGSGKMLRPANLRRTDARAEAKEEGRPEPAAVGSSSAEPRPAQASASASASASSPPPPPGVSAGPVGIGIAPGSRVRAHSLKAQPHLNGQLGTVMGWDEEEQRWEVRMDDGSGKLLKESNLQLVHATAPILGPGCRVQVGGLRAQPQLNGQFGTAVEWDEGEGRWKVRMDDGSGKLLRPANLTPVAGPPPTSTPPAAPAPSAAAAAKAQPPSSAPNGHVGDRAAAAPAAWPAAAPPSVAKAQQLSLSAAGAALNGHGGDSKSSAGAPQPSGLPPPATAKRIPPGAGVSVQGTVLGWDDLQFGWKVRLRSGAVKVFEEADLQFDAAGAATTEPEAVPPANLHPIPPAPSADPLQDGTAKLGARVRVRGLLARTDLNGSTGCLAEWDAEQERWKVRMDDGTGKMFKPANLQLCA